MDTAIWKGYLSAILYELQPIRLKDLKYICSIVITNYLQFFSFFKNQTVPAIYVIVNCVTSIKLRHMILFLVWVISLWVFSYLEFATVFVILTGFALIFINLGTRNKDDISAYSVFNSGFQRMMGTLTAEQFDREIRHNDFDGDDDDDNRVIDGDVEPRRVVDQRQFRRGKKGRRRYEDRLARRMAEEDVFQDGLIDEA